MPPTRWLRAGKTVRVAVGCVALVLFGCEAVLGLGDLQERSDTDASTNGPDAGTPEGAADGGSDGGIFNNITDLAKWDVCDLTEITRDARNGFTGGTFDGRYLYLAPRSNQLLRLDTSMPGAFCTAAAWKAFRLVETTADGGRLAVGAYAGSIYDGSRYVYFVPSVGVSGALAHVSLRYDTQADFASPASWLGFDTSAHLGRLAHGFIGGVFDGHYVYFVPNGYTFPGSDPNGLVVRYDVNGPFQDSASWTSVNLVTLLTEAPTQFAGGLYQAPYVYFIPQYTQYVTRYDTRLPLDVATSWATYDITTGGGAAPPYGFAGGAVVGTQIYLAPFLNAQGSYAAYGTVFKHDTAALADGFTNSGSWQRFDTKALPARPGGFYGAVADGRWVYFAPDYRNAADAGPDGSTVTFPSGDLARFDTTGTFTLAESWQVFNISTVNAGATSFAGAIFDGTFVYFPPSGGGGTLMARFHARAAPAPPPFTPSFL